MTLPKINIEARIEAPLQRVWETWTQPEQITQWNFASADWHCPEAANDLRTGRSFRSRMEARDGSMGFDFEGTYTAVVMGREISYAMPDGRQVTTLFEALGGNTRVQTSFDPEQTHSPEMQRAGWQAILDTFKKYAEAAG